MHCIGIFRLFNLSIDVSALLTSKLHRHLKIALTAFQLILCKVLERRLLLSFVLLIL